MKYMKYLKYFIKWIKLKLGVKPSYELKEVFTPNTSAEIAYIKRDKVERQIDRALDIAGKQLVIFGHSGSGKTTVLNHMLEIKKIEKITSRCTKESTLDSIILDAFDKLNDYYVKSKGKSEKEQLNGELSTSFSKVTAMKESSINSEEQRVLPPQITPQRLAEAMGKRKVVWVIEDFHKVEPAEKTKISQVMKLFMDIANDYPNTKTIVLGAADKGYEVVNHEKELDNRVSEIEVPLLSSDEIQKLLCKGADALNITFEGNIISQIEKYSNSLATIAHQIAYNLCSNNDVRKTQKKLVQIKEESLQMALDDFTSDKQDTYKELYLRITKQREGKYKNVEIILEAIANIEKKDITQHDILVEIQKVYKDYPAGNLNIYLKKLVGVEGEEVLRNNAGRYSFSDLFFETYIKMLKAKSN